jgi:hypothetical protein
MTGERALDEHFDLARFNRERQTALGPDLTEPFQTLLTWGNGGSVE